MLVQFDDLYGKPLWVNPVYVREIRATRTGCKVHFAGKVLRLNADPQTVADRLNLAMPMQEEIMAALLSEESTLAQQQQAAAAAAAG